jgi:UDPglucose 6-dehydrogenase
LSQTIKADKPTISENIGKIEMTDDIVIIGAGTVGRATGTVLAEKGLLLRYVDSDSIVVKTLRDQNLFAEMSFRPAPHSDVVIAFFCVPTPAHEATGYDLSALTETIRSVVRLCSGKKSRRLLIVIRSTTPPGTCDNFINPIILNEETGGCDIALVAFPEFLREASAIQDALSPRISVIGSRNEPARHCIAQMFSGFLGETIIFDDPTHAELVKISHNAFNAVKISFWNEIFKIGSALNLDMDSISATVAKSAEGSWNPNYGIRGGRAYGGACLPKDVIGLIDYARTRGIMTPIINAAHATNKELSTSCRDIYPELNEKK